MNLRNKFIKACNEVAQEIENGARFGAGKTANQRDCPVCAVGQVAARCGISPGFEHEDLNYFGECDAYELFTLYSGYDSKDDVTDNNDYKHWDACASALRDAATRAKHAK